MRCSHSSATKKRSLRRHPSPPANARQTRCFMSWLVVTERTTETMQLIVDQAPTAFQYCTDGFTTYDALNYHQGLHLVASSHMAHHKPTRSKVATLTCVIIWLALLSIRDAFRVVSTPYETRSSYLSIVGIVANYSNVCSLAIRYRCQRSYPFDFGHSPFSSGSLRRTNCGLRLAAASSATVR